MFTGLLLLSRCLVRYRAAAALAAAPTSRPAHVQSSAGRSEASTASAAVLPTFRYIRGQHLQRRRASELSIYPRPAPPAPPRFRTFDISDDHVAGGGGDGHRQGLAHMPGRPPHQASSSSSKEALPGRSGAASMSRAPVVCDAMSAAARRASAAQSSRSLTKVRMLPCSVAARTGRRKEVETHGIHAAPLRRPASRRLAKARKDVLRFRRQCCR